MLRIRLVVAVLSLSLLALAATACARDVPPPRTPAYEPTHVVFDKVVPSIVAVLNDDQDLREDEVKRAMKALGVGHAPKTVVDVSLRKEPTPHGTGFMIDGGLVLTAAHVIQTPDRLK